MEALLLRNAHRPPAVQAGIGSFATSMHLSKDAINLCPGCRNCRSCRTLSNHCRTTVEPLSNHCQIDSLTGLSNHCRTCCCSCRKSLSKLSKKVLSNCRTAVECCRIVTVELSNRGSAHLLALLVLSFLRQMTEQRRLFAATQDQPASPPHHPWRRAHWNAPPYIAVTP